jgi:hypothetical protein
MESEHLTTAEGAARVDDAPARLFTVRLWKEELGGGSGYRGTVREVSTEAFRAFRDFSDLVAFIVARMEQNDGVRRRRAEEVRDVNR